MNIRKELEACRAWDFYLVGSQKLGTARPDSDWDYVVTVEEGIIAYLVNRLGFRPVVGDIDTERVYGNNNRYVKAIVQARCPETGVKVQVAIVADASLKVRIIETLKENETLRAIDLSLHGKADRNRFWDALYAIAGWQGDSGNEEYVRTPKKKPMAAQIPVDDEFGF